MKTKILSIIFIIGFWGLTNAQDTVDTDEMVGFACYFSGKPSNTVETFTRKLKSENYKWISQRLNSENNAEKYMSVITLEKLTELGQYQLNKSERELISKIKNSSELVSVCSGCTYFQKVELKDMFTDDMLTMANNWLNYNFGAE